MKILIIPDVHGRDFWKYAKDHIDEVDKIIFLGDYLDPYPHEEITFNTTVENLKEIIQFKKDNNEKVVLLLGNHDLHYVYLEFMNCSRLNKARRNEMNLLFNNNEDLFHLICIEGDYLFSHAGIYQYWMNKYQLTIDDLLYESFPYYVLEDVSDYRGGFEPVGSCVWADITESFGQPLIDGYYQIVGHTQLTQYPQVGKDIACLDVRRPFLLDGNVLYDIEDNKKYLLRTKMIKCTPKPVKRGAILFEPKNYAEILETIGSHNMDEHQGQTLVNTKRHGWQNVYEGDYLVFDENDKLLKVLRPDDFRHNYDME